MSATCRMVLVLGTSVKPLCGPHGRRATDRHRGQLVRRSSIAAPIRSTLLCRRWAMADEVTASIGAPYRRMRPRGAERSGSLRHEWACRTKIQLPSAAAGRDAGEVVVKGNYPGSGVEAGVDVTTVICVFSRVERPSSMRDHPMRVSNPLSRSRHATSPRMSPTTPMSAQISATCHVVPTCRRRFQYSSK